MISEEMLKKAAAEADRVIRDSLPAPRECKHEFSSSFQKKMRRTLRKANHPMIYKLPKRVACFVLAAILGTGTWVTVDAGARDIFTADHSTDKIEIVVKLWQNNQWMRSNSSNSCCDVNV
ncbi:hypothetical protein FYJ45_25640 [Eisenbergiella tayi]|uniref:Uncharacterized protein n=1 Tax=Eisenbergiella porci TaxID=2652274 RepID=A0A6N7WLU9_9FIRM|nr:hypothetical protein [Eisenbergiella porci]MSS91487.1 hypothetical protein [Eisenbergiella porci]